MRPIVVAIASVGIIAIGEAINLAVGHPLICTCGTVKLWHGVAHSPETSQHLTDWYTPSHVIHGVLFYAALWLVARRFSLGFRLVAAILAEVVWEVAENTPWIIDRYQTATVSHEYYGDTVINSTVDVLATLVGFYLAWRLPVWASVVAVVALELFVGYMIRDNLTLNILMLLWPTKAILDWQAAG